MPRSVNHVASRARRKKILKLTRGYFGCRRNVWTVAKNTWEKGLTYAYRDRKDKKRNFRALWIQRINAAARMEDLSYSKLMGLIHKSGIEINRKVLADLALNNPAAFKAVVDKVKNAWTWQQLKKGARMRNRSRSRFYIIYAYDPAIAAQYVTLWKHRAFRGATAVPHAQHMMGQCAKSQTVRDVLKISGNVKYGNFNGGLLFDFYKWDNKEWQRSSGL